MAAGAVRAHMHLTILVLYCEARGKLYSQSATLWVRVYICLVGHSFLHWRRQKDLTFKSRRLTGEEDEKWQIGYTGSWAGFCLLFCLFLVLCQVDLVGNALHCKCNANINAM